MKTTVDNQTFGQAIETMKGGRIVSREEWGGKMFLFMQVPSEVPAAIIPRMTSLPDAVKDVVAARGLPLRYQDQFALVHLNNDVCGWSPSPSDALATDWQSHDGYPQFIEGHLIAGETVGTAKPLA